MRGRFISLEGGEGAGKSTQALMLADALAARGLAVVRTREPGGTPGAEAIRALLLDPAGADAGEGWSPAAEALLFAAARADHVERVVRPALERGAWVVCDRFLDSTRAYQAGDGGPSDADILELHRIGAHGLLPDLTLLLEASPATTTARLAARDMGASDRIGGRDAAYHAAVVRRFGALAAAEPVRFVRIDAEGAACQVHARVLQAIEALLAQASA